MTSLNSFVPAILLFISLISINPDAQARQGQLRKVENNAFQLGERLNFRVFYDSFLTGHVHAGEVILEIENDPGVINGRNTMNVVAQARSKGAFNLFFRVVNRYESNLDMEAIAPLRFMRRISEGRYRKYEEVMFNQFDNIAVSRTATVPIKPYMQDFISIFYYLRTNDFRTARPGDDFDVSFFLDDSIYVSRVVFDGREEITTREGRFRTLRFKPQVLEGSVFSQPYPMTLWISDDQNKIPVLIESGIVVGRIRMELSSFRGLKNPFTSKIE